MNRALPSQENFAALLNALGKILYGALRIFAWDSLKSGFIDIRHLARVPRVIALMGLVLVFGFIASILFNEPLRTSGALEQLPLSSNSARAIFVPSTAVPLALLAVILAWSLILTSALHIQRWARWGIFLSFVLVGAPTGALGALASLAVQNTFSFALIVSGAALCWLALLLAFILLPRRAFSITIEFGIVFGSVSGLFLLLLLGAVQATQLGTVDLATGYLAAEAIVNPRNLILPLICLSGAEIIEFGITFTGWGAQATRQYARRWMIVVLLGAFLLYRWVTVLWQEFLPGVSTAQILAWSGAALAVSCLIPIAWWRQRRAFGDEVTLKWKLGIVLLIVLPPLLVFVSVIAIGIIFLAQVIFTLLTTQTWDPNTLQAVSIVAAPVLNLGSTWRDVLYLSLSAAGLGMVIYGIRRARFSLAAFGMLLAWTQLVYWLMQNGRPLQMLRYSFADVELWLLLGFTALTLYWLARRELNADRALKLLALALFAWLLHFTDFLDNPLALFFGLAGISYTAFGILWAVLTAGGRWRVNGTSPLFPNSSRVLLAIGYVLMTLNVSHWFLVTHNLAERALNDEFTFVGLRVIGYTAAYLVIVEGGRAFFKTEK